MIGVAAGLGGYDGAVTPDEERLFERMDALEERLDEAGAAGDAEALAEVARPRPGGVGRRPGPAGDRVPAAIRDLVRVMDADHYDPTRVQGRAIPLRPPAAERVGELRVPVLAVAGALDVSDVAATARHLEASVDGARAVIWPDVAHMIGLEAPDRLAGLILDFLAPLPPWS